MTPQELRIGNLVDYEATTHVIRELHGDKVLHTWHNAPGDGYYTPYEAIKPIPLTPELLQKAGFAQYDNAYAKEDLSFMLESFGEGYYVVHDYRRISPIIEHLHQLQNLYWCLCGEELTVNL